MDNESKYVPDESYTESDKDDLTRLMKRMKLMLNLIYLLLPKTQHKEERVEASFITEIGSVGTAPGISTFYDAGNGWIYEPNMGWSFLKTCPSNCPPGCSMKTRLVV